MSCIFIRSSFLKTDIDCLQDIAVTLSLAILPFDVLDKKQQ